MLDKTRLFLDLIKRPVTGLCLLYLVGVMLAACGANDGQGPDDQGSTPPLALPNSSDWVTPPTEHTTAISNGLPPTPEEIDRPGITPEPESGATLTPTHVPALAQALTPVPTPEVTPISTQQSGGSSELLVNFAVKGDWGAGTPAQANITTLMCAWRERTGFSYVLTTGDNFYSPDGAATDRNYYVPEECLYNDPRHQWRVSWGNHDYAGSSTAEVLGAPSKYYFWTAGNVAFFVYDGSNVTQTQRDWLRNTVCSTAATVKIIYGHQPPYSIGPHGSNNAVQSMVHPVARDCGVQVVLSGHDHLYLRSNSIEGVTYIVSGGGGAVLYACGAAQPWVAICSSRHHFLYIEVDRSAIRIQAVGLDGQTFDAIEILH